MNVELHAIQSFAPANLNRDADGAPKECTFGGVRRARVSSQSWKRAIRLAFRESGTTELGVRTKRAHHELIRRIAASTPELEDDTAAHRAAVLLEAEPLNLSLKRASDDDPVKTGQLIFFRDSDLDALARLAVEHADELDAQETSLTEKKKTAKLSRELSKKIKTVMTSPGHALDVAMFGRMIAELPEANVEAACQVAHAIGTHRLKASDDYFTAVDDLKPEDSEGADMIGTIYFNASCFYRYAVIDTEQLAVNLGAASDPEHVRLAVAEFTRAFVEAIPSGKQSTFAARNPASAVLAVCRGRGAMNLANAFASPVDGEVIGTSIARLLNEFAKLESLYGDDTTSARLLTGEDVPSEVQRVRHINELIAFVASDA